jgi:EmrB/QacA subfamily drug resistance transporter
VFLVNVPVVIAGLILGYLLIPESRDPSSPRLDPVGAVLSIVGLGALLWGFIEAPSRGWGAAEIIGAFALGLVILGGFLYWELHSSHPMLDVRFFENPRFSAASGAITLTFLALFGVVFLLTQYLQSVLDYTPLQAGALLLPMSAVLMISAPLSSVWTAKLGNKIVVAAGLAVVGGAMLLFTTLGVASSTTHIILVTMVLALGMGNIMAPATDSIMGSLPRAKAGVGSAVNDTTRQVGGAVGVAVLGSVLASQYSSHMKDKLTALGAPKEFIAPLSDSIGKTLGVLEAPQAKPFASRVVPLAHDSFVSGLHLACWVAAGVLFLGMVCVILWLPARARPEEDEVAAYPSGGDEPVGSEESLAEPLAEPLAELAGDSPQAT